jgi:cell division protein FtsL
MLIYFKRNKREHEIKKGKEAKSANQKKDVSVSKLSKILLYVLAFSVVMLLLAYIFYSTIGKRK